MTSAFDCQVIIKRAYFRKIWKSMYMNQIIKHHGKCVSSKESRFWKSKKICWASLCNVEIKVFSITGLIFLCLLFSVWVKVIIFEKQKGKLQINALSGANFEKSPSQMCLLWLIKLHASAFFSLKVRILGKQTDKQRFYLVWGSFLDFFNKCFVSFVNINVFYNEQTFQLFAFFSLKVIIL